jgi:hypothetical protein
MKVKLKTNGGIRNYVYCAVRCGKCDSVLILKYLGVHDGRVEYDLPDSCPLIFSMNCSACRETEYHNLRDVEVVALEEPPPPDFLEQF